MLKQEYELDNINRTKDAKVEFLNKSIGKRIKFTAEIMDDCTPEKKTEFDWLLHLMIFRHEWLRNQDHPTAALLSKHDIEYIYTLILKRLWGGRLWNDFPLNGSICDEKAWIVSKLDLTDSIYKFDIAEDSKEEEKQELVELIVNNMLLTYLVPKGYDANE